MRKKILCLFMSVIMLASLAGCTFFEKNLEKNYKQVVAVIEPIVENGVTISGRKEIYKYELINSLNQNGQSLVQENGMTYEQAADYLLEQLVIRELILTDIERMIKFGEMEWFDGETNYGEVGEDEIRDFTDVNAVNTLIYNTIDSTLKTIREEILTERGLELPAITDAEEASTSTTYPVKEEEKDEDIVIREEKDFLVTLDEDKSRWPGYYGTEEDKSFGRETMRRFVALLKNRVTDNYAVTQADKDDFKTDDDKINNIINTKGIDHVYPMLWDTHYVQFLIGKSAEQQVKLEKIQKQIVKDVTVTDAEVKTKYNALLGDQMRSYTADVANYNTAMKDGSTTVLYHPTSKFFYVKHILLPFSDAQKANLGTYKSDGRYTQAQYLDYRKNMVDEIVVYPHLNGENDVNNPTNVSAVFNRIKTSMAAVSGNLKESERTFDDLIFLYNTDTGIFNNAKGYVESVSLDEGEAESYMPEFADLARKLYTDYKVGDVATEYAITDYGVHIMYFASKISAGKIYNLSDYQSPGQYKTYYDILKDELQTVKEEAEFENWQNSRITYYKVINPVFKTYADRYKDLFTA